MGVSRPRIRWRPAAAAALFAAGFGTVLAHGQVPGRNVNMVSGLSWPDGDPFLQRQNEPSVAASTRNPLHLLAGANDYRTVDLPGLPNDDETGDAWMGLFKSFDGGSTWRSNMVPGYPQDVSPEGLASPLKPYAAAADPVVRAGTNGLFYYSGIAFNRGTSAKSALFVARFIDNNNKESGDPFVYLDTTLVATNPGTAFIDKPWFAVDVPRPGAPMCSVTTTQPNGTTSNPGATLTRTQNFAGGAAYVVYSLIAAQGATTLSQLYFSRSTDCGRTWSPSFQISSSKDPVNQGGTIAIDPRTGAVYVAWRRFSADGTDDAIMVTRSMDQGRKWDPPGRARRFPRGRKVGLDPDNDKDKGKPPLKFDKPRDLADIEPFDEPTETDRFRSNAYPSMTIDDQGRAYVVWAERGFAPLRPDPVDGDARIMVSTSTDDAHWTDPSTVDNDMLAGHQLMPSIAFAGGTLMVAYYDLRQDVSDVFRQFIDETSALNGPERLRHTVDVRAAQAKTGAAPAFSPSVRVSEYLQGSRPGSVHGIEQLQFNPPNLTLFAQGLVPFMGDYINLAPSPAFVPSGGGWVYNTAPSSAPLFHAVWADNRDVVPPPDGDWTTYTPPNYAAGQIRPDFGHAAPACAAGRAGMRNQNIYTAGITGGLVAGSPGNTKQLDPNLQRSFVVFAQNATEDTRTFAVTITNQPPGGRASFSQFPLPPYSSSSPSPLTRVDVSVPRRSTISRAIFVTSSNPRAQVNVTVTEISGPGGATVAGGLASLVVLNPDISNPDIANPDISNPDISNPDISNSEVYNPDISNPDISNPDISNPDISNPDISNPDISNIVVATPDISNPAISNPDISNPDISNPDISNPDISNPDISNQSLTDTTWTITNTGNTTSSYAVKLLLNGGTVPSGIVVQLVLRKVYLTPALSDCDVKLQPSNVLLANITNPAFTDPGNLTAPDEANPATSNATLWLAPGETAKITLRVLDPDIHDGVTFDPVQQVTPAVVSHAIDTAVVTLPNPLPPIALPPTLTPVVGAVPSSGTAGTPLAPPITVRVTDAQGAVVPGALVSMSAVGLDGALGVLTGTTIATTNAAGIASFANLIITQPGTYQLRAHATVPGIQGDSLLTQTILVSPSGLPQWTLASGGNGHFYEYVQQGGLTWTQASAAANARTYDGVQGHLATIANAAENAFVNNLRNGGGMRAWIGLYDPDQTGPRGFEWITGEPVTYTNWASGEPNNPTTEFWVEMFGDGTWNNNQILDPIYPTLGYVVEYDVPSGVSGSLTYDGAAIGVGSWAQNISQQFDLRVDLSAQTTSLSIDGVPVAAAQNVPFFQAGATSLARVSMEMGTTGTQVFAWDDIVIRNADITIFNGNFDADTVGQPPSIDPAGAPEGDSFAIDNLNGSVLVRASSGNLINQPVELAQFGGTNDVNLRGTVAGAAPTGGVYTVSWKSLVKSPGTGPGVFTAIVVRDVNNLVLASLEYR